jgi:cytochrome P450
VSAKYPTTGNLPPRSRFPAIGIAALYLAGRPDVASNLGRRRGGDAFMTKLPAFGWSIVVAEPELAKAVFTADADAVLSGASSPLKYVLGRHSIFALDGDEHLRERRLLLPPFHGKHMDAYEEIFAAETHAEMAGWQTNKDFPTIDPFMRITLNAILRTVFGARDAEYDELRDVIPPLVKIGSAMTALPFLQKEFADWSPWSRFLRHRRRYDGIVDRLIELGRQDPDLESRSDVLALLLQARYEDGQPMTNDQIADELLTVLAAGHETTAGSLAWTVERLRRHPELLARLVEEAKAGGSKLREATIWEVQRTRPVIVSTERLVVKDTEIGPWTLPPGMHATVDFLGLHHSPKLFPDPQRFHPERFFEAPPETYEWVPFGGGRRRCVGAAFAKLEMDVVLRELLLHCDWVATTDRDERWKFRGVAFVPAKGGVGRFSRIEKGFSAETESAASATLVA